jgi:hypothetical protein
VLYSSCNASVVPTSTIHFTSGKTCLHIYFFLVVGCDFTYSNFVHLYHLHSLDTHHIQTVDGHYAVDHHMYTLFHQTYPHSPPHHRILLKTRSSAEACKQTMLTHQLNLTAGQFKKKWIFSTTKAQCRIIQCNRRWYPQ